MLFCKDHPFETRFVARGDWKFDIEEKSACTDGLSHEVCGFCFSVRYLLNLSVTKFVLKKYQIVERVVPLDAHLKKMNCDPFFFLSNKTRLIEVSLVSPYNDKIPQKADYIDLFLLAKNVYFGRKICTSEEYVP